MHEKEMNQQLIEETSDIEDWNRIEKLQMYQDMCSATRDDLAFPEEMIAKIQSSGVKSVLQFDPGEKSIGWFCVIDWIKKTTFVIFNSLYTKIN